MSATNIYSPLFADAQSVLGFVTSQTSIIEPTVYQTVYADIQYRGIVPVDTAGSELATSVEYYSADQYGKADWINGNADDIPKAGTTRAKFQTPVYTAGIGYGWGWEEIGRARMLNINLQGDDAMAARRAAEEMVDRVVFQGDASKGFTGLFNAAGVTPVAAANGDWLNGTTTPDEILADLNQGLMNVWNGTANTAMADTALLPFSHYAYIATTPRSSTSDMTILEYWLRSNIYTLQTGRSITVRAIRGLETAGAGGVARAIYYRNDPNVLRLHMPMPHRFLPVWQSGPLRWDVPGVMRLGGLDVRLPKQVVLQDGI